VRYRRAWKGDSEAHVGITLLQKSRQEEILSVLHSHLQIIKLDFPENSHNNFSSLTDL
jgi:hypothetical protein